MECTHAKCKLSAVSRQLKSNSRVVEDQKVRRVLRQFLEYATASERKEGLLELLGGESLGDGRDVLASGV